MKPLRPFTRELINVYKRGSEYLKSDVFEAMLEDEPPKGMKKADKLRFDSTWHIKQIAWQLADGDPMKVEYFYNMEFETACKLLTEMAIHNLKYIQ